MSIEAVLALVLAFAALLAVARLLLWRARAGAAQRTTRLRMALLLLAQPACAALLYFALLPPRIATVRTEAALAVLTAGSTPAQLAQARIAGATPVALPEAPAALQEQAERQPDLATALRRHPDAGRIDVFGEGLEARDREAGLDVALSFSPPAAAPGLQQLHHPHRLAPGQAFRIHGQARGVARIALYDPAGQKLADARPGADGRFRFDASARGAGLAVFSLQLLDGNDAVVERASVPVWTAEPPATRVLLLAAAPNPELKYLRRWAEDAGIAVQTRISLGGGVRLGDAVPLDAATLQRFDLLVLDARTLDGLGPGERAALRQVVEKGLGVLLRIDGAPSAATRSQLRNWGLESAGGDLAVLPSAATDGGNIAMEIHQRRLRSASADASALLRDADGQALGYWRPLGRGRIGVWPVLDSYQWVLHGDAGRHGELWSQAFAAIARPAAEAPVRIDAARVGERVAVCPAADNAQVFAPDGAATALLPDPNSGRPSCAAYWPQAAGWHWLQQGERRQPFFVRPSDDAPGLARHARTEATLVLAGGNPRDAAAGTAVRPGPRGLAWPWWLAWLSCASLLWWFERRRRAAN